MNDDEKENEESTPPKKPEPDPDITAPEIEWVINTYDPEKEEGAEILNEKK